MPGTKQKLNEQTNKNTHNGLVNTEWKVHIIKTGDSTLGDSKVSRKMTMNK